jgi:tetratricopeptide (TPR) repeat protein
LIRFRRIDLMRNTATLVPLVLLLAPLGAGGSASADTVTYRTSAGGSAKLTGEIVEFSGKQLRLKQPGGVESAIPAERVESFETTWTPQHEEGLRLKQEGKFAQAVEKFGQALRAEKRRWVQRRILADTVRCYPALGQHEQAASMFLILAGDDSTTQYFGAVPLSWNAQQPSPALESKAAAWLENEDQPAAALIGASWLLSTSRRGAALKVLQRQARNEDPRVAALSRAQVWRTEIVTSTPDEVTRWSTLVEQAPAIVRAGPYLMLGRAWSHCGKSEEAALAAMRVPILYADSRSLAADALVTAAGELVKLDRRREAINLYREAVQSYPEATAAAEAQRRLAELGAEAGN